MPPACGGGHVPNPEAVWQSAANTSANSTAFERTSKRRKGFPSETRVRRGTRVVHGDKELLEKLGRNDCAPAAPDAGFKRCCLGSGNYDGVLRDYYFQGLVDGERTHWMGSLFPFEPSPNLPAARSSAYCDLCYLAGSFHMVRCTFQAPSG